MLLEESHRGLTFDVDTVKIITGLMELSLKTSGFSRLMLLFEILKVLTECEERKPLVSSGFSSYMYSEKSKRIGDVYSFLFQNFERDLTVSEVAAYINMTNSAFCKFFKRHTCKTFSEVLNEIRIGHACKLLINQLNTRTI